MALSPTDARLACSYIRRLLRDHMTSVGMDLDILAHIEEAGLVRAVKWPGYHITLTEAGREFLAEHEPADDE